MNGDNRKIPFEAQVVVVGAGPTGLITSLQLAARGIKTVLVERNPETTKWPKMDITNARSMELLNRLGLADKLREQGVPQDYSLNCLLSTGLSDGGELITQWDLPSPNQWRDKIKSVNDGSMPQQPYQRISQAIFEAWLRPIVESTPNISCFFGVKFDSLVESDKGVETKVIDTTTGGEHTIHCKYLVGCDGAGSRVRRSIGIELVGGPVPMAMHLVHFKSRDLENLQKQGQFWHIFFTSGGVIISQDEKDTWTTHLPIPLDTDVDSLNPEESVYQVLGGSSGKHKIKIDKILVTSTWRPNLCIAERYRTEQGRVFLAGDSAHQNIPFGGYGMNTGLGDAFDIGWKLAHALNGHGGEGILESYEAERRPVAFRNVEMSGVHTKVHMDYIGMVNEESSGAILSTAEDGKKLRAKLRDHYLAHDAENKSDGIEMGYRNDCSPVVAFDESWDNEPDWNPTDYTPSTWPGARVPQVILKDGKTSVFDLFGKEYTLVDFTSDGTFSKEFAIAANRLNMPLEVVHLPDEKHTRNIWERDVVLVRPDYHVAWRSPVSGNLSSEQIDDIISVSMGMKKPSDWATRGKSSKYVPPEGDRVFTTSVGNVKQDGGNIEMLGAFQR